MEAVSGPSLVVRADSDLVICCPLIFLEPVTLGHIIQIALLKYELRVFISVNGNVVRKFP